MSYAASTASATAMRYATGNVAGRDALRPTDESLRHRDIAGAILAAIMALGPLAATAIIAI